MQQNRVDTAVDLDFLTGNTNRHVVWFNQAICGSQEAAQREDTQHKVQLHHQVIEPLRKLQLKAEKAGFELRIVSGYRSFERQLYIWNSKLGGTRPVLDDAGNVADLQVMDDWQKVQSVLRWSALPGASRHHWGTDLDIYDAASLKEGYRLQLTPEEVEPGGIQAPFHDWLDVQLGSNGCFFRPYVKDKGGIAPERWHLSYRPVADLYEKTLTPELLRHFLEEKFSDGGSMLMLDVVLDHFDEIFRRFVAVN